MLLSHLRPRHSGLVWLLGPPWPAKEVLGAAQDQNDSAEGAIILHNDAFSAGTLHGSICHLYDWSSLCRLDFSF